MSDLKNCPFCGGIPEILSTMDTCWVSCNCPAFDVQELDDEIKAIESWNTRANSSDTVTISRECAEICKAFLASGIKQNAAFFPELDRVHEDGKALTELEAALGGEDE